MEIVAQNVPAATPSKRERLLLLLRGLRAALDAVAHLSTAFDRRALAVKADTIHDASLARSLYVAAAGAHEAQVKGCGCERRFDRVVALGLDAQKADAVEDRHYGRAFDEVDAGRGRIRIVAGRFDRLLSGRSE